MNEYSNDLPNRKTMRWQGYDYTLSGLYFITICVQGNLCLFGRIQEGEMILNDAGMMVARWYYELQHKFPSIWCDTLVVMPNHIHCVILNSVTAGGRIDTHLLNDNDTACLGKQIDLHQHEQIGLSQQSLYLPNEKGTVDIRAVVQWFKTMTTNEYIQGVKQKCWSPFLRKLWQRSYWERIIRNPHEYDMITNYIATNPQRWVQKGSADKSLQKDCLWKPI